MLNLLALIPGIPFASALLLAVLGGRFSKRLVAAIGVGSIAVSSVISLVVAGAFLSRGYAPYTELLWNWIDVAGFRPQVAFYLDSLSLVMVLVVAFVAFWIHLYSAEFMVGDDGYSRFFAYMNLFVASMVTLLLANNLLLLFLGWEGVGLCSFLLIGFWYRDPVNGRAARKAFIVTRAGDTALMIGLLFLFTHLGTLEIQDLMRRALQWREGSIYPATAAFLVLGGAVGKSAQLPLQVWLPDAMAGPTPTSALIHAATMVTAGVYLIARLNALFLLAPQAQFAVAVIGAATLLAAGFSALTQRDLKRVLAYSTISQIGYMFVALGVGAWAAAIFHFLTHAFFKALLFLGAGAVIEALNNEHDIFRMGGLRKELPLVFWTFLIGGCSLAGLPLITAGYHSKDLIIWSTLASAEGHPAFWWAAVIGVFLTALYTFRLIFLVFFGNLRTRVTRRPGYVMGVPLVVLAFFSIAAGNIKNPLLPYLRRTLPAFHSAYSGLLTETRSAGVTAFAFGLGLLFAYLFVLRRPDFSRALVAARAGSTLHRLWFSDWGFDWLCDKALVQPVLWIAHLDRNDMVDAVYTGLARVCRFFYRDLSATESGRVRWYTAAVAAGTAILVAIVLFS